MKHTLLPTLALATLAAAASAQTVPVKSRVGAAEQFSVGVSYQSSHDIGGLATDGTGLTVDIRAALTGNVFLTASYSDLSIDNLGLTSFDPSAYTVGLGAKFAAGNGTIEASYAYRNLDLSPSGLWPTADSLDQHWIRLGYNLDLGNGLNVGLAALEIFNTESGVDDMTVAEVSLGYSFGKGFSANLSYATEDLILGTTDGKATTAISVRYGF